ncbi:MAG: hypothetical protein WCO10_00800 [bacterium]
MKIPPSLGVIPPDKLADLESLIEITANFWRVSTSAVCVIWEEALKRFPSNTKRQDEWFIKKISKQQPKTA